MKKEIFDRVNNRTIVADYTNETLTISGDYSSSTITTYWVVNRFNPNCPISISITAEHAKRRCDYINKENSTDTFVVVSHIIFV